MKVRKIIASDKYYRPVNADICFAEFGIIISFVLLNKSPW